MKNRPNHDELDAEEIAALEAALKVRDPYTGLMRPSYNEIRRQEELEVAKKELKPSATSKQSGSVLPLTPLLRSKPAAIATVGVLCAAVAFVAYANLRDDKPEMTMADSLVSELEEVVVVQEQKIETEIEPFRMHEVEIQAEEVEVTSASESEGSAVSSEEMETKYSSIMGEVSKIKSRSRRMELLREAIEVNPDEDEAHSRLAFMIVEHPKMRSEALSLATKAVDNNPDNARAWLVIGYVHQLMRDREAAMKAYSKCTEAPGPEEFVSECKALLPREDRSK